MKFLTAEVDCSTFKYPDYVRREPLELTRSPKDYMTYEGMSFEEIAEQSGEEVAQRVFELACEGFNLTQFRNPTMPTRDVVEFAYESRETSLAVYLSGKPGLKLIGKFEFVYGLEDVNIEDLVAYVVNSVLSK